MCLKAFLSCKSMSKGGIYMLRTIDAILNHSYVILTKVEALKIDQTNFQGTCPMSLKFKFLIKLKNLINSITLGTAVADLESQQ